MKIHNHNSNAPHEKVRTRSVVSKEAQQANGTVQAVEGGRASDKQQQKKSNQSKAAAATSSPSGTSQSTELEKRGRRRGLPKEEEEVNTESQGEETPVEEEGGGAAKRRRLNRSTQQQQQQQENIHTDEEEPNHQEQEAATTELDSHEQEQNDTAEAAGGEEEDAETESLVEDLNEDDRTSSSTVSAEETLVQVMESFNKGRISTINSVSSSKQDKAHSSSTASIDPLTMTMDDYQQQQQQQQQHDDAPMEDYEPAVTVVGGSASASDDIEDTDGTQPGNRLFRKKVKRKLPPVRPTSGSNTTTVSNSVGGGGGGVGVGSVTASVGSSDNAANCASKAKLQMVHEFPMLFLGLRRNRMFLVNSLAQWFDLNQRDIILTLRKIKQNESSVRLGGVFGLGSTEVELLFHKNVPKIADCLRNFIVWPDDITMKLNVPISLRQHFQRIHLILNYLVVRVKQNAVQELPADEIANSFCPNEQCHKLKYLVASTLDGCVCFVSRAFGVQTDDEQVLSQSGFLTKFKTNTNLIAGKNFHNFEDQLANGHDHTNNNGGHGRRNRVTSSRSGGMAADGDDDLERVLGGSSSNSNSVDNFEDIVSEKISKSKTFKLKNYIENILENFQSHQLLSPQTCIDARTLKLLDDIVVIVGALINLQKQEIE